MAHYHCTSSEPTNVATSEEEEAYEWVSWSFAVAGAEKYRVGSGSWSYCHSYCLGGIAYPSDQYRVGYSGEIKPVKNLGEEQGTERGGRRRRVPWL